MAVIYLIILALVQGITEFLPVSSSGHLVLTHALFDGGIKDLCWEENRMLDVAVHVGTLFSVLLYFRRDIFNLVTGFFKWEPGALRMIVNLIVASIPVIVAGFALQMWKPSFLCLVEIVAWTTLIFGIVLGVADRMPARRSNADMGLRDAVMIGLAQILALIPGTSRSGITMTMSRFLGYTRTDSAAFSMLLSIVAIGGAGFLSTLDLIESGNLDIGTDAMIAAALAFISGYIAISLMMAWLRRASFRPFVIYRIILGVALLGILYSGII